MILSEKFFGYVLSPADVKYLGKEKIINTCTLLSMTSDVPISFYDRVIYGCKTSLVDNGAPLSAVVAYYNVVFFPDSSEIETCSWFSVLQVSKYENICKAWFALLKINKYIKEVKKINKCFLPTAHSPSWEDCITALPTMEEYNIYIENNRRSSCSLTFP
jgi:hypothetical protein